jgi:protein-S-isoprenylcysteine O-methyltransferase Ste14
MVKRLVFFVYGVACYVVFLATFLYAIAFVGNLGTPTALDAPATGPIGRALAIDTALLALFALQHSIMARKEFKRRWTRIVPKAIERSTYVLFSSAALILLFWQWQPIGGIVWSVESTAATIVLRTLFAFGWGLVLISTLLIDHFDLFGLRQVWLNLKGQPYTPRPFTTPGPYRLVRHPLYVGWFFAFWMTPTMTIAHLVFAIATSAYILIAIQLEEHDLVREFGHTYEDYRRRVPMLVPFARAKQKAADPVENRAVV